MTGSKLSTPDDEGRLGPAMRLLTDRQRRFVYAMCRPGPGGDLNHTEAAEIAGYIGDRATLQTTGSRLYHDEKVRAGMLEVGFAKMGGAVPMAVSMLIQIATTSLKETNRMKAAGMILNRAGLPEVSKHEVKVTRELTQEEKIEKAIRLAKALGLDPRQMLGNIGIQLPSPDNSSAFPLLEGPEALEVENSTTSEGLEDILG